MIENIHPAWLIKVERNILSQTRACRQLSQMAVAAKYTPARKLMAVLS